MASQDLQDPQFKQNAAAWAGHDGRHKTHKHVVWQAFAPVFGVQGTLTAGKLVKIRCVFNGTQLSHKTTTHRAKAYLVGADTGSIGQFHSPWPRAPCSPARAHACTGRKGMLVTALMAVPGMPPPPPHRAPTQRPTDADVHARAHACWPAGRSKPAHLWLLRRRQRQRHPGGPRVEGLVEFFR